MQLWLLLVTLASTLAGLTAFGGLWPPLAQLAQALFEFSLIVLMLSVLVAAWKGH